MNADTDFETIPVVEVLRHLKRRPRDGSLLGLGNTRLKIALFTEAPERACLLVEVRTVSWAKAIRNAKLTTVRAALYDDGTAVVCPPR